MARPSDDHTGYFSDLPTREKLSETSFKLSKYNSRSVFLKALQKNKFSIFCTWGGPPHTGFHCFDNIDIRPGSDEETSISARHSSKMILGVVVNVFSTFKNLCSFQKIFVGALKVKFWNFSLERTLLFGKSPKFCRYKCKSLSEQLQTGTVPRHTGHIFAPATPLDRLICAY